MKPPDDDATRLYATFELAPGQRTLTEIDEIAEATLRSISLETMLKPAR